MAVIYRIDMSDRSIRCEEPSDAYKELGGRALTSAVVVAEVPPLCHPLSADNKLIIAPGILTGTMSPCGGRLSIGAKSPLTGTIKESNSGGTAAIMLAKHGIKAIILENKPEDDTLYRIIVTKEGLTIEPANELKGLGNYDTVAKEYERFDKRCACISIGPAGEMRGLAASIAITDLENRPTRHCGRGGLGAVMGSKGVKVMVIDPEGGKRIQAKDPKAMAEAIRTFASGLKAQPVSGEGLPAFGTNVLANIINGAGAYPTRNFSEGQYENIEAISGERQRDLIVERGGDTGHACQQGCTIKCSRTYVDKDGEYITKGPEYETVWSHGGNCGIDDFDAIARMDWMDDDLGLDTIEAGTTIALAMEAGVIEFGDAKGAIGLLEEVAKGTPMGHLIASGTSLFGRVYGLTRVPTVKGQAISAYDPRSVKGMGVTYATSTQGADHTAGFCVGQNILGIGGSVDPLSPEGQVDLSRGIQIATAAIDASGTCLFVAFAVSEDPGTLQAMCDMLGALFGRKYTPDDFAALGMDTLRQERAFNTAAGFTAADDRLPQFLNEEPLTPHNTTFDVPNEELDQVFNFVE